MESELTSLWLGESVIPKLTSLYMLSSLLNLLYNTRRLFPVLDLHSLMI